MIDQQDLDDDQIQFVNHLKKNIGEIPQQQILQTLEFQKKTPNQEESFIGFRDRSSRNNSIDQIKSGKQLCCESCKLSKNGKKCICTVSLSTRKQQNKEGCKQCGCIECGQSQQQNTSHQNTQQRQIKPRGCCARCDKRTSRNGKNCICQIPNDLRNTELPPQGCKNCGCIGCSKDDQNNKIPYQQNDVYDQRYNLYNLRKNPLIMQINDQLNIFPPMVGVGVPERTHTYIMGKQRNQ